MAGYDSFSSPVARGSGYDKFSSPINVSGGASVELPPGASDVNANNVVRSLARGVPVAGSFLDELEAATNATLAPWIEPLLSPSSSDLTRDSGKANNATWEQRYEKSLGIQRGMDNAFDTANPGLSTGLQIGGGIAATLPLAATAAGAKALGLTGDTMLSRIGAGTLSGAGIGFGSGFGEGEGGLNNRLASGGIGAGFGVGLGALQPIVGAVAGKAVKGISKAFSRATRSSAFDAAAAALGHGAPEPVAFSRAPHVAAARMLGEAAQADQLTPAALRAAGPDATTMELGPNLGQYAAGVVAQPGEGQTIIRNALAARRAGSPSRIGNALDTALGPQTDVDQAVAELSARQASQAGPLYDAVRNVAVGDAPNLRFVLSTQAGKRAIAEGQKIAEGFGHGLDPNYPTVGQLDYVKRALDDQIGTDIRAGRSAKASSVMKLRDMLVKELDAQTDGAYAAARNAYAGPAAIKDAYEAGQKVFNDAHLTTQGLRRQLAGMSASEREAFLTSGRAQLAGIMSNARNEPASAINVFQKGGNVDKLKVLIGDKPAQTMLDKLGQEHSLALTSNAVKDNSFTAAREAAKANIEQHGWIGSSLGSMRLAWYYGGAKSVGRVAATRMFAQMLESHDAARTKQMVEILARGLSKTGPARDKLIKSLLNGVMIEGRTSQRAKNAEMLARRLIAGGSTTVTKLLTKSANQQQ